MCLELTKYLECHGVKPIEHRCNWNKGRKFKITKMFELFQLLTQFDISTICPSRETRGDRFVSNYYVFKGDFIFGLFYNNDEDYQFYTSKEDWPKLLRIFSKEKIISIPEKKKVLKRPKPIMDESLFKDLMKNTIEYIEKCSKSPYDIKSKRGIILKGHPGNGKSMFCNYITGLAKKKNLNSHYYNGSEIVGARKEDLINMFNSHNIVFFDDVDMRIFSSNRDRKSGDVLSAMDGVVKNNNFCVRIFTTNEDINDMDPAFRRPGRIDRIFEINEPSAKLIEEFVNTWESITKEIALSIKDFAVICNERGYNFAQIDEIRNAMLVAKVFDEEFDFENVCNGFAGNSLKIANRVGF